MRSELGRLGIGDLPHNLDFERRPVPAEIDADTLFTQVCGYPLQTIYRAQAAFLAAPVYSDIQRRGNALRDLHRQADAPLHDSRTFEAAGSLTTAAIPIRA